MSEGVTHGGRMRRKLALFEGAGDDLGVASPTTLGNANGGAGGAPLSDTKTPLLAERRGAGGYGAAVGPDGRKTGGARPYRFSFYSNSLPTTIHARSLAELPAEGQTFEELFCGSRPHGEDEAAAEHHQHPQAPSAVSLDGRLANLASSQQHSNSGAATPMSTVNNASTSKLLGSLPAGVSATTMRNDRPKTAVMRSDEDAEANTWWLDVTCPTDQEMKTLSKVRFRSPLHQPSCKLAYLHTPSGLWHPPSHDGGYPDGGDARKDRALPELLLCLLPLVRAGPLLADLPRTAQHVHHRVPGGNPFRAFTWLSWRWHPRLPVTDSI